MGRWRVASFTLPNRDSDNGHVRVLFSECGFCLLPLKTHIARHSLKSFRIERNDEVVFCKASYFNGITADFAVFHIGLTAD